MFEGFSNLTAAGELHAGLATLGIVSGAEQLLRTKRDQLHRVVGYVYVGAMVVADLSALSIYRFTGRFGPFHVAALLNLVCVALALRPMLARPRGPNWKIQHYMWISWSYVGLMAAALTELILRAGPVGQGPGPIISTVVGTGLVTAIGAFLIRRNRPRAAPAEPKLSMD